RWGWAWTTSPPPSTCSTTRRGWGSGWSLCCVADPRSGNSTSVQVAPVPSLAVRNALLQTADGRRFLIAQLMDSLGSGLSSVLLPWLVLDAGRTRSQAAAPSAGARATPAAPAASPPPPPGAPPPPPCCWPCGPATSETTATGGG